MIQMRVKKDLVQHITVLNGKQLSRHIAAAAAEKLSADDPLQTAAPNIYIV